MEKSASVDYAITITLKPVTFKLEPEIQYDKTIEHIYRQLRSITSKLTLVVELTKNCNIHAHGIVQFDLRKKNVIKEFHKLFRNDLIVGFVNIKQINDYPGWRSYIIKDIGLTYRSINRRPIIHDDYECFDIEQIANYGCQWQ